MSRGEISKGECKFCKQVIAKNVVKKHLAACIGWKEAISESELNKGENEKIYHLRAQPSGQPEFWLNLEMRGSATLKDLDGYLRAIWLECCGHLSQFSFGGWSGDEIPMKRSIDSVLNQKIELTHIYDFGTSSETLITKVGWRKGKPVTPHPIVLLVRNLPPEYECMECNKPAKWLCMECLSEENEWGVLCDEHVKNHPHNNYEEPVRLVNSPRMGLCGYNGPAVPPY
jgi:hypothetical protein